LLKFKVEQNLHDDGRTSWFRTKNLEFFLNIYLDQNRVAIAGV